MKKGIIILTLLLALSVFLSACNTGGTSDMNKKGVDVSDTEVMDLTNEDSMHRAGSTDWQNIEMWDVNSNEVFKVSDFAGKTVFLETFAVWCPTCTKQQKEMNNLHKAEPEVVSIALDIDPNEDVKTLQDHTRVHGFDWRYSIANEKLTTALVSEFGVEIVNPPTSPVVMICEDGSSRLLSKGFKEVGDLQDAMDAGC